MAIRLAIVLPLLLLTGCASGLLYTDVVVPYSTNFHDTQVGTKRCEIKAYKIREPVTRMGLSAEWDTNLVRRAAHEAGIERIYFAERRTLILLFNIYRRNSLIVYGE